MNERTVPVVKFSVIRNLYCRRTPASSQVFSPEEICALLEEILLVFAPIDSSSFEFQGDRLIFAALFCYFCKNTSFSPAELSFFLEKTFSVPDGILIFSGIAHSRGRNNRWNFPGESAETRL